MRTAIVIGLAVLLAGCVESTAVMDGGNGTFVISSRAAPLAGGAFGARNVSYEEAQRFCSQQDPTAHVVVLETNSQSVYRCSAGGFDAAGDNDLRFRCEGHRLNGGVSQ